MIDSGKAPRETTPGGHMTQLAEALNRDGVVVAFARDDPPALCVSFPNGDMWALLPFKLEER